MYPPMQVGGEEVVLRPMNCPHHILVFASEPRSAREMPVRLAELATMFRMERSGVVGGLSRVRQMTLNDGHVFCAPDQIGEEIATILGMVGEAYRVLAIPPPRYRLSLRGDGPKYVGRRRDVGTQRGDASRDSLDAHGLPYEEAAGEAAFYGPKIDLQVRDPQGREETLSTVQVDFHLPARFDLSFRRGDDSRPPGADPPEHRLDDGADGRPPPRGARRCASACGWHRRRWSSSRSSTTLVIMRERVRRRLLDRDIRVELDDRDATLGARVRDAQQRRVPYLAVVGRREVEQGTVAIRLRDATRLEARPVDAFVELLEAVISSRSSGSLVH